MLYKDTRNQADVILTFFGLYSSPLFYSLLENCTDLLKCLLVCMFCVPKILNSILKSTEGYQVS